MIDLAVHLITRREPIVLREVSYISPIPFISARHSVLVFHTAGSIFHPILSLWPLRA